MTAIDHIQLDALGGASGDMFLAALLDMRPDLAEGCFEAMRAAGLPRDWAVALTPHGDGTLTGSRVAITPPADGKSRPSGHFAEIRARLRAADLAPEVRARAIAIFTLLAEAEAEVHGVEIDRVHFHEIADWDSVADITGAAWLIEALGAGSWSLSPLPLGGGRVRTAHGPLLVPAPATAKLLRGLEVIDDGIGGERVTPTGAAILRHLAPAPRPRDATTLLAEGTGFGTRTLPGLSNVLRAVAFGAGEALDGDDTVAVICFEVDDQTAEDLAVGLDRLRALPGVLDVRQTATLAKKGRLATSVQILAAPAARESVTETCFLETTTIGLRWRLENRVILPRRIHDAEGPIPVKIVERGAAGRSAKADIDAVAGRDDGHGERTHARRGAERAALEDEDD